MAHLIAGIARGNEVRLLCLRAQDEPPVDPLLLERCEQVLELVPGPRRRASRLPRRIWSALDVARGTPLWASHCRSEALAEAFSRTAREWRPHVIQFECHVMGQYAHAAQRGNELRVLNQHEPGTPAARETLRGARGTARVIAALDAQAWRRYEPRVLREMDVVVTFTEKDATEVRRLAAGSRSDPSGARSLPPVECIPLGVELPDKPLDSRGDDSSALLYVGNFLHHPNADAAVRLARAILPRVRRELPAARLVLVGASPPPEVRALTGPHVTVTGEVPSVQPYLDAAQVVVLPIRRGGGMRVKALEALAAGKAVVATPLALEGLAVQHGAHVLIAEDDEAFAAATISLLRDPQRRESLGTAARRWAEQHLGWEETVRRYEELYERLLAWGAR